MKVYSIKAHCAFPPRETSLAGVVTWQLLLQGWEAGVIPAAGAQSCPCLSPPALILQASKHEINFNHECSQQSPRGWEVFNELT